MWRCGNKPGEPEVYELSIYLMIRNYRRILLNKCLQFPLSCKELHVTEVNFQLNTLIQQQSSSVVFSNQEARLQNHVSSSTASS